MAGVSAERNCVSPQLSCPLGRAPSPAAAGAGAGKVLFCASAPCSHELPARVASPEQVLCRAGTRGPSEGRSPRRSPRSPELQLPREQFSPSSHGDNALETGTGAGGALGTERGAGGAQGTGRVAGSTQGTGMGTSASCKGGSAALRSRKPPSCCFRAELLGLPAKPAWSSGEPGQGKQGAEDTVTEGQSSMQTPEHRGCAPGPTQGWLESRTQSCPAASRIPTPCTVPPSTFPAPAAGAAAPAGARCAGPQGCAVPLETTSQKEPTVPRLQPEHPASSQGAPEISHKFWQGLQKPDAKFSETAGAPRKAKGSSPPACSLTTTPGNKLQRRNSPVPVTLILETLLELTSAYLR